MQLKLAQTLYIAFIGVISLTAIFATVVYLQQHEIKAISTEVELDDVPGALLYMQVLDEAGDMQSNVLEYLTGEADEVTDFEENFLEYKSYFRELKPLESTKLSDREKMDKIDGLVNQYATTVRAEIFGKYDPAKEQLAIKKVKDLEATTGRQLEVLLDKLKDEEFADALNSTDLRESLEDDLPGVRYYLEMVDEAGDMLNSLTKYVAGNPNEKLAFNKDRDSFAYYLSLIKPLERKPNEIVNLNKIQEMFDQITDTANQIFAMYDPAGKAHALKTVDDLEHDVFSVVEEILDSSADEERTDASTALKKLNSDLDNMSNVLIINTISAIIIGLIVAWFLARTITRRIDLVVEKAKAIASGDLCLPNSQDTRQDELGQLAQSIDEMQDSLKQVITEISTVATELASSTTELDNVSKNVSEGSQNQAEKAEMISTAVEQMTATVNEVASQSSQAARLAQEAGEQAEQGGEIMSKTVNSIQEVSTVVNESAQTVDSLGKRGEQIGQIIKVITDIADQTNLLALNAAIEAARAGEFGRGFSVVADEVRGLAERTSKATKEVSDSISAIQSETVLAVDRMETGTELVEQSVRLTEGAGDALRSIVERAQNVNSMIHSIATATEQQTAATKEIASDIAQNVNSMIHSIATATEQQTAATKDCHDIVYISDIAGETVSLAGNATDAAGQLHNKVTQLETLVAKFKLS